MKKLLALVLILLFSPLSAFAVFPTKSLDLEAGSSQYATIADASQTGLDITGNLTIETWVKIESAPGTYMIAAKWNGGGAQRSYKWFYNGSGLNFQWTPDNTSVNAVTVATDLGTGTWKHVAVVFTAATATAEFFVDGVSIGSGADTATSISKIGRAHV